MNEHFEFKKANSGKWAKQMRDVRHVKNKAVHEANKLVKAANRLEECHREETENIEKLTARLKLRKADLIEQEAALEKCLVEKRQLRNDRNKEISAADAENW